MATEPVPTMASPESISIMSTSTSTSISNLKDTTISPTLWYRIHALLYDLQNFSSASSNARLETVLDASYLGPPYFTPTETDLIKNTLINNKPLSQIIQDELDERLNRRMKKRVESGDFRVCAAHDLAPILGKALGIDYKRLVKDKTFVGMVEKNGLEIEGHWEGLGKKSFSPKKK